MEKLRKLKKIKRARKHGFRKRSETRSGRDILKRRRRSKRSRLSV